MAKDNTNDLYLLKMSVEAIRKRFNDDLDAVVARIDNLLPEETPRRQVPASLSARRKYYKEQIKLVKG